MLDTLERQRRVGLLAWVAAWAALVLGQLHALARHATEDGRSDLEQATTRFWAEPAADLLSPLLTWADADAVYLTYGKFWFPVAVAMTMCAFVVRRRREPFGFEKWAWRIALTGYVGACVATFADYWTQWASYNAFFETAFLLTIPAVLITLVGSSLLGVALVKRGFRRLPAWLLLLTFPLALVITTVTSLGNVLLPVLFAFGLLGRTLSAAEPAESPALAAARGAARP